MKPTSIHQATQEVASSNAKVLSHQVLGPPEMTSHGANLGGLQQTSLIATCIPVEVTLGVETKVLIIRMALVR